MKKIIIGMLVLILMSFSVLAATIIRTVPSTATPGGTFTMTYTSDATGTWGASIQETASGGCKFPSGSATYKTVMLSEDGATKTISITAPASGSCTFTGDYKYDVQPVVAFSTSTVNIGGSCTPSCSGKVCGDNGCGGVCGTCQSDMSCSNGQCVSNTGCSPACNANQDCLAGTCVPKQVGIGCTNHNPDCQAGKTCVDNVCVDNTPTNSTCQIWEKMDDTTGACALNMTYVWIGAGIVGLIIVMKMFK